IMQQAAGDLQAPLHAARKSLDLGMTPVAQADDAQHLFDALGPEALRDVIEHGVKDQVFLRCESVIERWVLKDHADGLPDLVRLREDIETGQDRAAASRRQKRGENVD